MTIALHVVIFLGGISIAGGAAVEIPADEASRYLGEIERKIMAAWRFRKRALV